MVRQENMEEKAVRTIAICEDDRKERQELLMFVREAQKQLSFAMDVETFRNGEELLASMRAGKKYELLLLDILMDGMNGIETAREARRLQPGFFLAFITSSREFGAEAFEMDAVHYLVKPVHMDSLLELFRRFFRRSGIPVKMLELKWGSKSLCVPMHRITRIQSSNKGVDVYLQGAGRPQWADVSFSKVEEMLDEEYFLRISRGLLVQMNYILCMEQNVCRFRDGTSSLISRREKKDIRRKYNDFLFRGMMEEEENE